MNLPARRVFNPIIVNPVEEKEEPKHIHPFSEEEVEEIKKRYKELQNKSFADITLEDVKITIVPYNVIHRTEVFNIKVVKEKKEKVIKEKVVKEKKEKVVKGETVRKLTKKQYQEKLMGIIMKLASGGELSEEESEFYTKHQESEGSV